ncbi:ATP-binding protein [Agrobacterium sp.]|uniref:hybrid sensor histidine kinase/response regulator n=1 Tax=Agrobacterium sp. TaxID=361 RepID=UPI0028AB4FF7|nr:ATP-binding protein [Agrobacterium sp.]
MSDPAHLRKHVSGPFEDAAVLKTKAADSPILPALEGPEHQKTAELRGQNKASLIGLVAGAGLVSSLPLMWNGLAGWPLSLISIVTLSAATVPVLRALNKARFETAAAPQLLAETTILPDVHDAMGDIAVLRGMDRRIIEANDTFREMTGCNVPVGLSCEEIGLAFRPGGKAHCYDVEIATPYGQRIFTWQDAVVRLGQSNRLVIQSVARDVTDERRALMTREEARQKAEKESAVKSRLLATVAHEIRLPLSGILGMNHLLSQTKLNDEQRNYLDGTRQSGQALVQLVEDLLDFSTMEAGRFRLNPRAENLRRLLESIVEMLAHRAHEKGIEIASTVAANVPEYLDFDPARLRQVLFNLIGNAVKFTASGGVLIRTLMDGDQLVITISDTGPGMTKAEQARVFGEFEQAGSTRQRSAGTGLGLAISARIVREFGGSLSVESVKGKGSVFILRFRAGADGLADDDAHRGQTLTKSNVLLLSPEGMSAMAAKASILSLGGRCRVVSDMAAVEALDLQDGKDGEMISDIIVDHRCAGLFGDIIKRWPCLSEKPVRRILLVNPEERATQLQGGYDAWLIRPLREKSLADVLSGRLRGMERRDAINDNQPGFGGADAVHPAGRKPFVLVAEDDPVNARILRAVLEKSGHEVNLVTDFPALLAAAVPGAAIRPDLIISDFNMPGGEALDVLPHICREYAQWPRVPVIVLSADTSPDMRQSALEAGVRTVLSKPVDPKQLLEEIHALLPQAESLAY